MSRGKRGRDSVPSSQCVPGERGGSALRVRTQPRPTAAAPAARAAEVCIARRPVGECGPGVSTWVCRRREGARASLGPHAGAPLCLAVSGVACSLSHALAGVHLLWGSSWGRSKRFPPL